MLKVVQRNTLEETDVEISTSQKFLYRHFLGRCILKLLIRPVISKIVGRYMNSKCSKRRIRRFAEKNRIQLEDYQLDHIHSFNDFFSRKIKDGKRPIALDCKTLISPCDSKLSVFKIEQDSIFYIKESYYKIEDLLKNKSLAETYIGGYCLIFRLGVDDYHRYCYLDDGFLEDSVNIKGVFHTVNPICLEKYNFFKTNHRIYTILHTLNFGEVIQVEVGAMMVGKIVNYHKNYRFHKGEEKGKFLFGGSTIVLLVKDIINIDEDILQQSSLGNEVQVRMGERIGVLR